MAKKFYITTAIDYTDDVIHIGHSYQKVVADVLARYHKLLGEDVYFLTGTDEHGGKVEKAAQKAKEKDIQKFVDQISKANQEQLSSLLVAPNRFIRTTDPDHIKLVREFWLKVKKSGDIYLDDFEGIYCPDCEGYKTKSDLIEGKCPFHPKTILQNLKEKNYFFKWSKYEDFLRKHILIHPDFIQPESQRNEMLAFLKQGLEDIPISRASIKWGIPVPDDPSQTIYVWFDALLNYLSGAPEKYWPADLHLLGKDNTRWHALLWPAMLKSAGYELPKTVYGHGFLTINGQKISKSLGNVIRPKELVERYGSSDAVRYLLLRFKPLAEDGDITFEKFDTLYNADLANGLGNLVARVAKLCESSGFSFKSKQNFVLDKYLIKHLNAYRFDDALARIWAHIDHANKLIDKAKPWEQKGKTLQESLWACIFAIQNIAYHLQSFLPETAEKIKKQFTGPKIKSEKPLFPRIK